MNLTKQHKNNLKKAAEILKNKEIEQLELYRFGIYHQYEMAGKKVKSYLLDDAEENLEEDEIDTLTELLTFTTKKNFIDNIGFPDEGQNKLILTNKGELIYKTFSI